jgi:hypothetical protein
MAPYNTTSLRCLSYPAFIAMPCNFTISNSTYGLTDTGAVDYTTLLMDINLRGTSIQQYFQTGAVDICYSSPDSIRYSLLKLPKGQLPVAWNQDASNVSYKHGDVLTVYAKHQGGVPGLPVTTGPDAMFVEIWAGASLVCRTSNGTFTLSFSTYKCFAPRDIYGAMTIRLGGSIYAGDTTNLREVEAVTDSSTLNATLNAGPRTFLVTKKTTPNVTSTVDEIVRTFDWALQYSQAGDTISFQSATPFNLNVTSNAMSAGVILDVANAVVQIDFGTTLFPNCDILVGQLAPTFLYSRGDGLTYRVFSSVTSLIKLNGTTLGKLELHGPVTLRLGVVPGFWNSSILLNGATLTIPLTVVEGVTVSNLTAKSSVSTLNDNDAVSGSLGWWSLLDGQCSVAALKSQPEFSEWRSQFHLEFCHQVRHSQSLVHQGWNCQDWMVPT